MDLGNTRGEDPERRLVYVVVSLAWAGQGPNVHVHIKDEQTVHSWINVLPFS